MNPGITSALDAQGAALALRSRRQAMLSANIANADTPGYKAIDFDFSSALQNALGATRNPAVPVATSAGHFGAKLDAAGGASGAPAVLYRIPSQPSADDNSVDMDLERTRFADNALRYEASLRFLNGQIRTLMSAIQG